MESSIKGTFCVGNASAKASTEKYRPRPMENDTMADEEDSTYEELQDGFESKVRGFGRGKYGRILRMAHTPSKDEYTKTIYITALGILLIGFVGFAIWWLMTVLPKYF
jgi:protein transport protein SEC61 subunit gamma-like protein